MVNPAEPSGGARCPLITRPDLLLDNWRVETADAMPAKRRREGWTRQGTPLPHNQPWYDRFIKAGGKSSFEKF